jgi:hypothetical protein
MKSIPPPGKKSHWYTTAPGSIKRTAHDRRVYLDGRFCIGEAWHHEQNLSGRVREGSHRSRVKPQRPRLSKGVNPLVRSRWPRERGKKNVMSR